MAPETGLQRVARDGEVRTLNMPVEGRGGAVRYSHRTAPNEVCGRAKATVATRRRAKRWRLQNDAAAAEGLAKKKKKGNKRGLEGMNNGLLM
ncbi:hypothetical protein CBOM_06336 [Ceraceosorus bombacis]|uniref:Uncharacterized protein n=1 Tax=Ceraceosorus bombacis TaxID=401625 RepID=A0A0P1BSB1_9BASI|nr:hypothetical protein CBOM_06336 [Ceraceosorus bombacis]